MNKCPFWSTEKRKIECYNECPMQLVGAMDEGCVFKEYLCLNKIEYKEIIRDDVRYSDKTSFDLGFTS